MKLSDIVRKKPKSLKREMRHQSKKNDPDKWNWPDGDGGSGRDMSSGADQQPLDPDKLPDF